MHLQSLASVSIPVAIVEHQQLPSTKAVSGVSAPIISVAAPYTGGAEFLVNTTTFNPQNSPAVAVAPSGTILIAWTDNSRLVGDTSGTAIRGQLFNSGGRRIGDERLVNSITLDNQSASSLLWLESRFIVTWTDASEQGADRSSSGIVRGTFEINGGRGVEVGVNTTTSGAQFVSRVTALASGGYVITWTDNGGSFGFPGSTNVVRGQVYDVAGAKVGQEFLANTPTSALQEDASAAALASGGFVVFWTDASQRFADRSGSQITGQFFDAMGNKAGAEFQVNNATEGAQRQVRAASLESGGFVLTWMNETGSITVDGASVSAQIFDPAGNKVGAEFIVNTHPLNDAAISTACGLAGGGFVIAWAHTRPETGDGSGTCIMAQIYNASGAKVGGAFIVNVETPNNQGNPAIAALPDGGFVITWTDASLTGGDGSGTGIKARIFLPEIAGTDASETLFGNAGDNRIRGGLGGDILYGGEGADLFIYDTIADAGRSWLRSDGAKSRTDYLADFASGSDKIDLSAIDAVSGTPDNDAFVFIGPNAFTGRAGELRYEARGSQLLILADIDGDALADMAISINAPSIQALDFVL